MQCGKRGIERGELSSALPRQFGQPCIRDLSAALKISVRHVEIAQIIAPPLMARVGAHLFQGIPSGGAAAFGRRSHVQSQERPLGNRASGEAIPPQTGEPPMSPLVVDMNEACFDAEP